MKLYNILAIVGFILLLMACIYSSEKLATWSIGAIIISVPLFINDVRKNRLK